MQGPPILIEVLPTNPAPQPEGPGQPIDVWHQRVARAVDFALDGPAEEADVWQERMGQAAHCAFGIVTMVSLVLLVILSAYVQEIGSRGDITNRALAIITGKLDHLQGQITVPPVAAPASAVGGAGASLNATLGARLEGAVAALNAKMDNISQALLILIGVIENFNALMQSAGAGGQGAPLRALKANLSGRGYHELNQTASQKHR